MGGEEISLHSPKTGDLVVFGMLFAMLLLAGAGALLVLYGKELKGKYGKWIIFLKNKIGKTKL
ncbi:MAG: LPXTG cell wall anchor domain-containing protein [Lachnospiraceae bacterium]|nr:LPXTG cell wall anchor domain-containing protein [Lachnospiraceae bacterium]